MRKHILLLISVIILTQACTSGEVQNPTEPALTEPTQSVPALSPLPQFPEMSPMDWIISQPFQDAPASEAALAADGFPDGYEAQENEYQIANLPSSGFEVQITQVTYEHAVDGQVYTKESVSVQVSSHQNPEARLEHLGLLIGSEDSWEYRQVSDHLTARFYSESGDGRVWISGPYMIAIWSGIDVTAGDPPVDAMVDTFAALYLELYPPD